MRYLYTAKNRKTRKVVCRDVPVQEAAKAMGFKGISSVNSSYMRNRDGQMTKWIVTRKEAPELVGKRYTVWDNHTDEIVGTDLTAKQATELMGLKSVEIFYSTATLSRKGVNNRWYVESYDPEEEEE